MKTINNTIKKTNNIVRRCLTAAALMTVSSACFGGTLSPLVDDFNSTKNNSLGIQRQYMNDAMMGGSTTTEQNVSQGILSVSGTIVPPRGQPGWASSVLPLNQQGLPQDASAFHGIRLLVKVNRGNISISAASTEVTNFDYHAAPVTVTPDGKYHEVKIPFSSMKRAWSKQTSLNTETLTSLSIVAYALQADAFAFEVDEVSFYTVGTDQKSLR